MDPTTKIYKLSATFAKHNDLPVYFAANILRETQKAVYLYGKGTLETQKSGVCCICGRALTHPVSVLLGIGPECGGHYWNWNAVGGYTLDNIERLKSVIDYVKIDSWVPKSVIREILPSEEQITTPTDHKMLQSIKTDALDAFNSATKSNEIQTDVTNTSITMPIHKLPEKTVTKAELTNGTPVLQIRFDYSPEELNKVKSLEGRRYNPEGKYWTAPISIENLETLLEWGYKIDKDLQTLLDRAKINLSDVEEIVIPGLKGTLFPFQNLGVGFIEAKGGRALIADEMGLGKTVQALAWLQLHKNKRPAIIVVPASLKLNWYKEAMMWMPNPNAEVLIGTTPYVSEADILIINYDILSYWVPTLISWNPQVLIMDEVHSVKNNKAKRTKAVKELAKGIPHVIGLSGTPIVNRPIEAYNAISMIDPTIMPSYWSYVHRYCGARRTRFGLEVNGATNTEELHQKLVGSIMLRRKKTDVLKDLPDKMRSFVPIELDNRSDYRTAESNFIAYIRQTKGAAAAVKASNAAVLAEIEGLKQIAVSGKLKQAIEWIKDFLDADGKLVVMAVHKFVIEALMEEFSDVAVKIDGSVTGDARQKAVDDFQNNPNIRLFIGNIQAAGVGITLTAASSLAFLELPWTPGQMLQAEDRVHRIGQKNCVTIYNLIAVDTIEEKIIKLLGSKHQILNSVLDGESIDKNSIFQELLDSYAK